MKVIQCCACGAIHRLPENVAEDKKLAISCSNCYSTNLIDGDTVSLVSSKELETMIRHVDIRMNKGIPIRLKNNIQADIKVNGKYLSLYSDASLKDELFELRDLGYDIEKLSLAEALMILHDSPYSEMDTDKTIQSILDREDGLEILKYCQSKLGILN